METADRNRAVAGFLQILDNGLLRKRPNLIPEKRRQTGGSTDYGGSHEKTDFRAATKMQ
jgi:hypothetical protein